MLSKKPFHFNQMEATQPSVELQSLQTPLKEERKLQMEPKGSNRLLTGSSRRTRSQLEPDWSLQEMLTLVNEITVIESDFRKALSSYQKWKIVTDNCNSLGVIRSLNHCRRKWDLLLTEYKKIKDWEFQSGTESYWTLEDERKMEFGLSVSFDRELFESIDLHFKALEDRSYTNSDSDAELPEKMDSGSKKKRRSRKGPRVSKIEEREQGIVLKLREHAELIRAILREDLTEGLCHNSGDKNPAASQMEFRRWQGNELIKALGALGGTVDHICDMISENV